MRRYWWKIAFVVLIGLAGYGLYRIGIREIFLQIRSAEPVFLSLSILSMAMMFLLWHFIWITATRSTVDRPIPLLSTLPIFFSGVLFNTLTPSASFGGEPVRVAYMKKIYGGQKSRYLASILLQKSLNYVASTLFLLISLIILAVVFKPAAIKGLITLVLIMVGFVAGLLIVALISHRSIDTVIGVVSRLVYLVWRNRFKNRQELATYLRSRYDMFYATFGGLIRRRGQLVWLFFLSLVARFLFFLSGYFVLRSMGIYLPFSSVIIALSIMAFVSDIPISPGGIGISEGALVVVYSLLGLSPAIAASVALLTRGVYYLFSVGAGFISFLYMRIRYA